jgi:hypothetical protein
MTKTYEGKTTTLVIGCAHKYGLPILIVIHNRLEVSNELVVLQYVVQVANQVVALYATQSDDEVQRNAGEVYARGQRDRCAKPRP